MLRFLFATFFASSLSIIFPNSSFSQIGPYTSTALKPLQPIKNEGLACFPTADITGLTVKGAPLKSSDPEENFKSLSECLEEAGIYSEDKGTEVTSEQQLQDFCKCNEDLMVEGTEVTCSWVANIDDQGRQMHRPLSASDVADLQDSLEEDNCIGLITYENRKILPSGKKVSGGLHSETLVDIKAESTGFSGHTVDPDSMTAPSSNTSKFKGNYGSSKIGGFTTDSGTTYEQRLVYIIVKCWEKVDAANSDPINTNQNTEDPQKEAKPPTVLRY